MEALVHGHIYGLPAREDVQADRERDGGQAEIHSMRLAGWSECITSSARLRHERCAMVVEYGIDGDND
eukprot:4642881-Pyramimonas_sp.AAC.1